MHSDSRSGIALPAGVRPASRGQVAAAWFLGLALFIATAGIGYIAWSLVTWGRGRSPAQRMLGLRCWLPLADEVAGWSDMAVRQISGFCLNGPLALGFFIWLFDGSLRSVGDAIADTIVLSDPDGVLAVAGIRLRFWHAQ
ncbi:MAG TPA: RDD family protein [Trebonia sp.]|nr:RDD family protein [Trebonia sp.]